MMTFKFWVRLCRVLLHHFVSFVKKRDTSASCSLNGKHLMRKITCHVMQKHNFNILQVWKKKAQDILKFPRTVNWLLSEENTATFIWCRPRWEMHFIRVRLVCWLKILTRTECGGFSEEFPHWLSQFKIWMSKTKQTHVYRTFVKKRELMAVRKCPIAAITQVHPTLVPNVGVFDMSMFEAHPLFGFWQKKITLSAFRIEQAGAARGEKNTWAFHWWLFSVEGTGGQFEDERDSWRPGVQCGRIAALLSGWRRGGLRVGHERAAMRTQVHRRGLSSRYSAGGIRQLAVYRVWVSAFCWTWICSFYCSHHPVHQSSKVVG